MREAIVEGDFNHTEEEVGDLLLAVVNTARLLGIDSEEALHKANQKFFNRFALVEKSALSDGGALKDKTPSEMLELWEKAKQMAKNA